jgi:hypothetical protein
MFRQGDSNTLVVSRQEKFTFDEYKKVVDKALLEAVKLFTDKTISLKKMKEVFAEYAGLFYPCHECGKTTLKNDFIAGKVICDECWEKFLQEETEYKSSRGEEYSFKDILRSFYEEEDREDFGKLFY